MEYHLKPPFFVISPQASFEDAWEVFCCELLSLAHDTHDIRRRRPPDQGADLIWEAKGIIYQCKSTEGTLNFSKIETSIRDAITHQNEVGRQRYVLCTNVDLTGKQEQNLREILPTIEFLTESYWAQLCKKFANKVANRFCVPVPSSQIVRQMLGSSARFVQLDQVKPADEQRSRRYYEGALLSWDILAANADVRRDIHDELLNYVLSATDQARMLCLHGESGAGKSTLAWRLAIEASQVLQWPLLHLRNNEESDIWYKLEEFLVHYASSSVILVDDIFRDSQVRHALTALSMAVPMLIIATTRTNEIPASLRLPFDPYFQVVASPTPEEKAKVLQKLGRDEAMLSTPERKRLRQANSWLVMMLELTSCFPHSNFRPPGSK